MKKIDRSIFHKLSPRSKVSHKGNFGRVLIIAGSENFAGAAIMSASAAVYSGAGLVTLATAPKLFSIINITTPEVMTINYNDDFTTDLKKSNVIVIGPGLEIPNIKELLKTVIKNVSSGQTLIIDASALNVLANDISLLHKTAAHIILTPHSMEWQRLSKISITDQSISNNQKFIKQLSTSLTVILKSHQTQIYDNDIIYQNIPGNPGMATGGSGDTLAGIIAAFCAQFNDDIATINAAVFLHSDLANQIYQDNYIVLPEKLIQQIPKYMKKAIL